MSMKVEKSILYFVTGNKNKFSEISQIFKKHQLSFKLTHLDIDPIEIQADNLEKVALFKLRLQWALCLAMETKAIPSITHFKDANNKRIGI